MLISTLSPIWLHLNIDTLIIINAIMINAKKSKTKNTYLILSIGHKGIYSGKMFFRLLKHSSLAYFKNCSLKCSLGTKKWFFCDITMKPFIFKSVRV